jgi:hypothetical protein
MGEHGWQICGKTEDRVVHGAQWVLETWIRIFEDHDGWQDILEDATEGLFPHQYGEIMAKDGDITPDDESTMMRAELRTERLILTQFVARYCFLNGISSEAIVRAMEANE